jgi:hypothetical protein
MATLRTLAAAALLLLASAGARMAGAGEIMHTPAEIRACLCLDQAVTAASAALYEETVNFEAERKALAEIEARADAAQQNSNATDMAERDKLGELLNQRDAAIRHFAAVATPQFNAVTDSYNRAADAFNHTCGGKAYDWSILPDVQKNLICDTPK